jgi:two-component system alkaline phosphatase synthesis response regulator PhoP/two-component system response regulator VicR
MESEHPKRVLVAEDEPNISRLLQLQLQRHGCEVVVAQDGQEALDALDARAFDLVILDVMMPYVDGLSVLRRIRENPATQSLFVAVVTVKAQDSDVSAGYGSGADLYVTKPFEPQDVQMILDAAFPRS